MNLSRQLLYQLVGVMKVFREKGWCAGFVELGRTILRIFYQRTEYIVIERKLSEPISRPYPKLGLVIHQVETREEIARLSSIADLGDMARFYRMFDHGSIAFAAIQNDQVVGYCWVSRETDRSVNRVQPPLRPSDACVHDLFVSPDYRSQGLGRALISHRLRFLREHRYKRAIGAVRGGNAPAFKINKKTGYAHIGEMSYTRILFWDSFHYNIPGM